MESAGEDGGNSLFVSKGNPRDSNSNSDETEILLVVSHQWRSKSGATQVFCFFQSADRFQRFSPLRGQDAYTGFQGSSKPAQGRFHLISILKHMNKLTWLITQKQIAAGDVESAIIPIDPDQVPDDEIIGLHGNLPIRIEGAGGMADVITDPASRKFFRALHARWPWAGFFLRLDPINTKSSVDKVVDLAVFMSLLLVHVDYLTYATGIPQEIEKMVGNFMKTCHKAGDEKHKTSNRVKIDGCPSDLQLYSQPLGALPSAGDRSR
jgi:hypothetical protein